MSIIHILQDNQRIPPVKPPTKMPWKEACRRCKQFNIQYPKGSNVKAKVGQ